MRSLPAAVISQNVRDGSFEIGKPSKPTGRHLRDVGVGQDKSVVPVTCPASARSAIGCLPIPRPQRRVQPAREELGAERPSEDATVMVLQPGPHRGASASPVMRAIRSSSAGQRRTMAR